MTTEQEQPEVEQPQQEDEAKDEVKDEQDNNNEVEEAVEQPNDVGDLLARIEKLEQQLAKKAKRPSPSKGSKPPVLPTPDNTGDKNTDVITREDVIIKMHTAWKKSQGMHI